ncbi:MAG: hypothetical protein J7L42_05890, partial [Elusimicrobia bacterium]|nr:hypothetical protein [Elusimicrobiota bacterium]
MILPVIVFSIIVTVAIITIVIFFFVVSKKRRKLKNIAEGIGAQYKKDSLEGTFCGHKYQLQDLTLSEGNKGLRIILDYKVPFQMLLWKKNPFSEFLAKLSIVKKTKTGIPEIDKNFTITTPSKESVILFFQDFETREKFLEIMKFNNLTGLSFFRDTISVDFQADIREIDSDFIESVLKFLSEIGEKSLRVPVTKKKFSTGLSYFITGAFIFLNIAGFLILFTGLKKFYPLGTGIFIFSIKWILIFLFCWFVFYLRFLNQRIIFPLNLVVLVLSLSTVPVDTIGAIVFTNGFLDKSPVKIREARVIRKVKKES